MDTGVVVVVVVVGAGEAAITITVATGEATRAVCVRRVCSLLSRWCMCFSCIGF